MEFSIGRAAQASPLYMYRKLQKPGQKWGGFGWMCFAGNLALMAFYTVVCGWLIYYFCKFADWTGMNLLVLQSMISNPAINVTFLLVTVLIAFIVLSFNLQGGLERITKIHDVSALLVLMLVLAIHSLLLQRSRRWYALLPETGFFQN